ncbi:hypothetical protein BGY98DRAFT_934563 [Russula aff. rugulosa BPL654]|nr:hypothetical protein BGY98DRAFT_934563 [Russula aff. rugulosa BPL654]
MIILNATSIPDGGGLRSISAAPPRRMFVAYLLKGVLIAIYVAYWSVQMGPANEGVAGGSAMELLFFGMHVRNGLFNINVHHRLHPFYDDAAAPRVKTCLSRRLRKQVDPKTDWGGSAAYVFLGNPPSSSSLGGYFSPLLDLEEPHGSFATDVVAINEHVGHHVSVAPPLRVLAPQWRTDGAALEESSASRAFSKDYWEGINVRRVRRWGLFQGVLLSIMGSWATYATARYFIAYRVFPDRRSAALPLGIFSVLSVLLVIALALSFILPYHIIERRPQLRFQSISPHHILQILLSFFLFAPTIVNLVLVCVWRNVGSGLSLRGRCHWSPDAIWVGVGGQCAPHAPAWGVWLTAPSCVSYRPEDVRRMDPVEISHVAQVGAPSRPSLVVPPFAHKSGGFPQRSLSSSRMEAIPERSDTPNREHVEQENTGPDSAESSTLSDEGESKERSAESGATATTNSRDMQMASSSSRLATLVANVPEEELQGFAHQFRALVDRVSRELEESRISEEQDRASRTPPLHHVLDTHTPYMTIDEFGREVTTEEPIAILGGVIKRMPTIESVGSRELASLRSATLVSGGGGGAVLAPRATIASFNDAASASLASASQPSSRSNSIHRLRTPSELGELVRDALRARAQARPFHHHHRRVLEAEEVIWVFHFDVLRVGWAAMCPASREEGCRRERDGRNLRTEWSRSWASSSPSATSTGYFTAGTSGSLVVSGSGGGGDPGTGSSDGGPQMKT